MSILNSARIKAVERLIGSRLPAEYIEYLQQHEPIVEGGFSIPFDGEKCRIRNTFRLDAADDSSQLDDVCRLVADVLPCGALPIAEDWAGNFFCLTLTEPNAGQVMFWDHERDADDSSIRLVSPSFQQFLSSIVPDGDTEAYDSVVD